MDLEQDADNMTKYLCAKCVAANPPAPPPSPPAPKPAAKMAKPRIKPAKQVAEDPEWKADNSEQELEEADHKEDAAFLASHQVDAIAPQLEVKPAESPPHLHQQPPSGLPETHDADEPASAGVRDQSADVSAPQVDQSDSPVTGNEDPASEDQPASSPRALDATNETPVALVDPTPPVQPLVQAALPPTAPFATNVFEVAPVASVVSEFSPVVKDASEATAMDVKVLEAASIQQSASEAPTNQKVSEATPLHKEASKPTPAAQDAPPAAVPLGPAVKPLKASSKPSAKATKPAKESAKGTDKPAAPKPKPAPKKPKCARKGCATRVPHGGGEFCSEDCELAAAEAELAGLKQKLQVINRAAEPKEEPPPPAPPAPPAENPEDAVRAKVVTSLASALTLAEQELTSGEWDVHVRAASVAEAVERALYGVFGGVGKEYRSKFRSLHFNIKDPNNPELRWRVLDEQISPTELVHMGPTDLANRNLAEWRTAKEELAAKTVQVFFGEGMQEEFTYQRTLVEAQQGSRVRKTHKGEEVVETVTEEMADAPSQKEEQPPNAGADKSENGSSEAEQDFVRVKPGQDRTTPASPPSFADPFDVASDGAEIPSAAPPKETPLPPDPAPAPAPLAAPPTAPSEASKAPVQAIPIASYMDLDRRDNPNHTCISTAVGVSSTAVGGVASDIAKVIVPSTLNPTSKQEGSSGWAKSRDEPEDSPEQASWLEDFEKEQRSNQEAAGAGKEDVAAAVPGGDKLRKRGWAFRGTSAAASEPIDPGLGHDTWRGGVANMCAVPDGSRLLMQTRGEERAAVSTILPDHLQFKGKVRLSKLEKFFVDIKKATSRQVVLLDIKADGDSKVQASLQEAAIELSDQERSLVAELGAGSDLYILPECPEARLLLPHGKLEGGLIGVLVLRKEKASKTRDSSHSRHHAHSHVHNEKRAREFDQSERAAKMQAASEYSPTASPSPRPLPVPVPVSSPGSRNTDGGHASDSAVVRDPRQSSRSIKTVLPSGSDAATHPPANAAPTSTSAATAPTSAAAASSPPASSAEPPSEALAALANLLALGDMSKVLGTLSAAAGKDADNPAAKLLGSLASTGTAKSGHSTAPPPGFELPPNPPPPSSGPAASLPSSMPHPMPPQPSPQGTPFLPSMQNVPGPGLQLPPPPPAPPHVPGGKPPSDTMTAAQTMFNPPSSVPLPPRPPPGVPPLHVFQGPGLPSPPPRATQEQAGARASDESRGWSQGNHPISIETGFTAPLPPPPRGVPPTGHPPQPSSGPPGWNKNLKTNAGIVTSSHGRQAPPGFESPGPSPETPVGWLYADTSSSIPSHGKGQWDPRAQGGMSAQLTPPGPPGPPLPGPPPQPALSRGDPNRGPPRGDFVQPSNGNMHLDRAEGHKSIAGRHPPGFLIQPHIQASVPPPPPLRGKPQPKHQQHEPSWLHEKPDGHPKNILQHTALPPNGRPGNMLNMQADGGGWESSEPTRREESLQGGSREKVLNVDNNPPPGFSEHQNRRVVNNDRQGRDLHEDQRDERRPRGFDRPSSGRDWEGGYDAHRDDKHPYDQPVEQPGLPRNYEERRAQRRGWEAERDKSRYERHEGDRDRGRDRDRDRDYRDRSRGRHR